MLGPTAREIITLFDGVGSNVRYLARKLGIPNLGVGIGCGVGLGHGFGVGITLRAGALQQVKFMLEQGFSVVIGRVQSTVGENPAALQGITAKRILGSYHSESSLLASGTGQADVLGEQQQKPSVVAGGNYRSTVDSEVARLHAENNMLRTLLRHQEQIEELKKQNALLQCLLEGNPATHVKAVESIQNCSELKKPERQTIIRKCFKCRLRNGRRRA
eukprot:c21649_g1_i3 orf=249-899(+)